MTTTSINLHEILYGFYKVRKEILKELLEFKIVDFTRRDALFFTLNRAHFERFFAFGLKLYPAPH